VNPWLKDDSWYEIENEIAYGLSPIESVSCEEVGAGDASTSRLRDQPRRSVTDMQIVADLSLPVQHDPERGAA
jgi:hypothetical protein